MKLGTKKPRTKACTKCGKGQDELEGCVRHKKVDPTCIKCFMGHEKACIALRMTEAVQRSNRQVIKKPLIDLLHEKVY